MLASPPRLPTYEEVIEEGQRRELVPYRVRSIIKGLYHFTAMPITAIAAQLGRSVWTVHNICREQVTPRVCRFLETRLAVVLTRRRSRRLYSDLDRLRVINFITKSSANRRLTYHQVSQRLGLGAHASTIRRMCNAAGYRRCVARGRLLLKQRHY